MRHFRVVLQAEGAATGVHEEVGIGSHKEVCNLEVRPLTSNSAAFSWFSVEQSLFFIGLEYCA